MNEDPRWAEELSLDNAQFYHEQIAKLLRSKKFTTIKVVVQGGSLPEFNTQHALTGPGWVRKHGDALEFVFEIDSDFLKYDFDLSVTPPTVAIYQNSAVIKFYDARGAYYCHYFVVEYQAESISE